MFKPLYALAAIGLLVALIVGLSQTHQTARPKASTLTPAEVTQRLAGSPPALAALHGEASQLLPGGAKGFKARLASLKGHPAVVNKWGSWCGPCRAEFPLFQRAGVTFGRRIAFLGLNAGDNHGDAATFLKQFPISYPSYEDPGDRASLDLGWGSNAPLTIYFNARGKQIYEHQGQYTSQAQLNADIRRYTSSS